MGQHSCRERDSVPKTGNRDRRRTWMCKPQSPWTMEGHTTDVHCPDATLKQPEAVAHMGVETVAHMGVKQYASHSAAALDQPDDDHEEMREALCFNRTGRVNSKHARDNRESPAPLWDECLSCDLTKQELLEKCLMFKAKYNDLWNAVMEPPIVEEPPRGMSRDVLQTTMDLIFKYRINGIEGVRQGHIVAVARAEIMLAKGHVKGSNAWQHFCQTGMPKYIDEHADDLWVELNHDGAHVIDASTGCIVANRFFSDEIARGQCGGSGAAAACAMSQVPGSVVFKISQDGAINEYREGRLFCKHCGPSTSPSSSAVAPVSLHVH